MIAIERMNDRKEFVMYINPSVRVGVHSLSPQGTNSTMFTLCCSVAICDDEGRCPHCGREVIGCDLPPDERGRLRWNRATGHWDRQALKSDRDF